MKVFSNSSTSSTTGTVTIVAAVEDSSKLGADVLNMSLGAASGDQTLQDPEQAAVQNANEAGTAAVISAGNSGTSASASEGVNKDFYGLSDLETVGTPGGVTRRHHRCFRRKFAGHQPGGNVLGR